MPSNFDISTQASILDALQRQNELIEYLSQSKKVPFIFSPDIDYLSGEYVIYLNPKASLYQFTQNHPAGSWDPTHVSLIDSAYIDTLMSNIYNKQQIDSFLDDRYTKQQTDTLISSSIRSSAEPHNYLFDGKNLRDVFTNVSQISSDLGRGRFYDIRIGDYIPVELNGVFRDYSYYTVPSGVTYYYNPLFSSPAGTTSSIMEGEYNTQTAVKIEISGNSYYCNVEDCLPYFLRTLENESVTLEVAGINTYWRYGDTGLAQNINHLLLISRDCLSFYTRMRKFTTVWETPEETNPWRGSALYKTLNDPDYGIVKLLESTDVGPYIYAGPNNEGMRAMLEHKSGTTPVIGDRGRLFLPYEPEIWGYPIWSKTTSLLGCNLQIPIFSGSCRHISKMVSNSRASWWTASTLANSNSEFCTVHGTTYPNNASAVFRAGVPICFIFR